MIKAHLTIWFTYWILVLLLPVHSRYSSVHMGFLIQCTYVVLVAFGWFFGVHVLGQRSTSKIGIPNILFIRSFVVFIIFASVVGFAFLLFDKVVIQGISFLDGFGSARVQWQNNADARTGKASSVFSATGYLLGQGYFLVPAIVLHYGSVFKRGIRNRFILISVLLAMANSIITGGRSTILLFLAFTLAGLLAPSKRSYFNWKLLKKAALPAVLILVIAVIYSGYIFLSRAGMNDINSIEYVVGWIEELTLIPNSFLLSVIEIPVFGEIIGLGVLIIAYVTHSFSVTTAIWEFGNDGKQVLFGALINLFARSGVIEMRDLDWYLSGKLASVPGSLYYQYGWTGLILGSGCLGILTGLLFVKTKEGGGVLSLMLYVILGSTVVLGPSFLALDFLMAPFILSSAIASIIICRFGASIWR
jgi:oligosaccharide repeat unit polymerase